MSIEAQIYLAENETRRRRDIRRRTSVIAGAALFLTSAILLISGSLFFPYLTNSSLRALTLLPLIGSFGVFGMLYLQSGQKQLTTDVTARDAALEANNQELNEIKAQLKSFTEHLKTVEEKLPTDVDLAFRDLDQEVAIRSVTQHIGADAIKAIFAAESKAFEQTLTKDLLSKIGSNAGNIIVDRLMREIKDLRLRSNLNLLIGMIITLIGLYLLWMTVSIVDTSAALKSLANDPSSTDTTFLRNLVLPLAPRILLVIFIEIFAYFFLRLYRDGLSEIKYFQNELTNIQSKVLAVEMAFISGEKASMPAAFSALSQTERNFILQKDQTTVELEKAKSESELTRTVLKAIPSLFKQKK